MLIGTMFWEQGVVSSSLAAPTFEPFRVHSALFGLWTSCEQLIPIALKQGLLNRLFESAGTANREICNAGRGLRQRAFEKTVPETNQ